MVALFPSGTWRLCKPKPNEIVYRGVVNPCLAVIYRVRNDGPAAVLANGIFLDPGTSVDVSVTGPATVAVALHGRPKCAPGAVENDEIANGTYDLLCCDCCCPPHQSTSTGQGTRMEIGT
jgi:hypothetical protein